MKRRLFAAILVAVPLCVSGTQAQTSKKDVVTIRGIVLGADGKPVPAAAVTCQSSAGMKPRAVLTGVFEWSVFGLGEKHSALEGPDERNHAASAEWEYRVERTAAGEEETMRFES